jgi:hypothetical protein
MALPGLASPSVPGRASPFGSPPSRCSTGSAGVGAETRGSAWNEAGAELGRPGSAASPGGAAGGGCPPPGCAAPASCPGGAATGPRTAASPPAADASDPGSARSWPGVPGGASGARCPAPGGGAASLGRWAASRLASGVDVLVSSAPGSGDGGGDGSEARSDPGGSAGSGRSGSRRPGREVGSVGWSTQAPSCGPRTGVGPSLSRRGRFCEGCPQPGGSHTAGRR